MNRRGFVGLLAGLAGALGLRGQNPPPTNNGTLIVNPMKNHFCQSLDLREQPCSEEQKAGEEYCPLGHSQRPGTMMVLYTSGDYLGVFWPTNKTMNTAERVYPKVCSICGVVYVPPEKKP